MEANACSIGFRSGEYGGRNRSLQPRLVGKRISTLGINFSTYQLHLQPVHVQLPSDEYCNCLKSTRCEDQDMDL